RELLDAGQPREELGPQHDRRLEAAPVRVGGAGACVVDEADHPQRDVLHGARRCDEKGASANDGGGAWTRGPWNGGGRGRGGARATADSSLILSRHAASPP